MSAAEVSGKDLDGSFSSERITAREEAIALTQSGYQDFLIDPASEELAKWRGLGYDEFSRRKKEPDFVQDLLGAWQELYEQPYVGMTVDGKVRRDVHRLLERPATVAPVVAALSLIEAVPEEDRAALVRPLDAPTWRAWSNPEFVVHRVGLRLEELPEEAVEAVHGLMRASLSREGYERAREAMELNGFLGELTELPRIMNDRSYWIAIYGDPSAQNPWGWQLFGHHLALNVVFVGGRQVIAPVFIGAEPALSDERPPLFDERERQALALASSLTPEQRARAVLYESVLDPAMPEGRIHPADERHVAGAFRDNRVVPYEGLPASELSDSQRAILSAIVEDFLLLLPIEQRRLTMGEVASYLPETYLSWYGGTDGSQPFYFRIHGPVLIAELDHHAGVWLDNRVPQRFHVHTTLRMTNGNDYGKAYLAQWRARHGR